MFIIELVNTNKVAMNNAKQRDYANKNGFTFCENGVLMLLMRKTVFLRISNTFLRVFLKVLSVWVYNRDSMVSSCLSFICFVHGRKFLCNYTNGFLFSQSRPSTGRRINHKTTDNAFHFIHIVTVRKGS
jgi:hypothetical protein